MCKRSAEAREIRPPKTLAQYSSDAEKSIVSGRNSFLQGSIPRPADADPNTAGPNIVAKESCSEIGAGTEIVWHYFELFKLRMPANEATFAVKEFVQTWQRENVSFDGSRVNSHRPDIKRSPG